jgi:hypothetical protein
MAELRIARLLNQAQRCGVSDPALGDALADYLWAECDDGGKTSLNNDCKTQYSVPGSMVSGNTHATPSCLSAYRLFLTFEVDDVKMNNRTRLLPCCTVLARCLESCLVVIKVILLLGLICNHNYFYSTQVMIGISHLDVD